MKLSTENINFLKSIFPYHNEKFLNSISSSFPNLESMIDYLLLNKETEIEELILNINELKINMEYGKKKESNFGSKISEKINNRKIIFDTQETQTSFNKSEEIYFNFTRIRLRKDKFKENYSKIDYEIKKVDYRNTIYNYPNLFPVNKVNTDEDPISLRKKAKELVCSIKFTGNRIIDQYYVDLYDENKDKADKLNKRASEIILSRMEGLDFHGLFVKECLMYLDDFLRFKRPGRLKIVTGRSERVRPAVLDFFKVNEYVLEEDNNVFVIFVKKVN
ncbi:hypothetical protein GVAV_002668 [Gurleya vavrai]